MATTVTCRAGDKAVETGISIGPAQAALACNDLPATLAGTAVVCLEDLDPDGVKGAKDQVTVGLA
ncbi:MAG TPA: hypothetical protein VFU48_00090 [Nitrospira sp.]|nr:hypothetical protein [Nitrospira sp.]